MNLRMSLVAVAILAAGLGACTSASTTSQDGIGFRQARHAELAAVRDWRACRDDALTLDTQARAEEATARYLASARLLERCEAEIGSYTAGLPLDERMRAYALAAQNHFKGGDVQAARQTLGSFMRNFSGHDLYFADGSSFIETMQLLLGLAPRGHAGQFAEANVSAATRSELRRVDYWANH